MESLSPKKKYKMATGKPELMARRNKKALLISFLTLVVIGVVIFVLFNAFKAGGSQEQKYQPEEVAYKEIEAKSAKDLIDSQDGLIILDVSDKYDKGHISGAVNVQLREIEMNLDKLDRDKPVLVYAHYKVKSVEVANVLTKNGFTNVYRLQGEYPAWVDADYPIEEGGSQGKINDLDGDGLNNQKEQELGSNPLKSDTDGDGLLDCQEEKLGTNLIKKDTDNDGYSDKEELDTQHDPLATPDEVQKKTRASEEIDLWSINYKGDEGKVTRYMKEGQYVLEVEASLAKLVGGEFYEVILEKKDASSHTSVGRLELVRSEKKNGTDIGHFELKFTIEENYYDYVNVFIMQKSTSDQEGFTALRGEFDWVNY